MANMENQLKNALTIPNSKRKRTQDLSTGNNEVNKTWDLIVKYSSDDIPDSLRNNNKVSNVSVLREGYLTAVFFEDFIDELMNMPGIDYVEKSKKLYYGINNAKTVSCINPLNRGDLGISLTGDGVIVGVIDSGIDYNHPAFIDENGETRLLGIWDMTEESDSVFNEDFNEIFVKITENEPGPPAGFSNGIFYPQEWINYVLSIPVRERRGLLPQEDFSGHGTAVAGIACGSGTGGMESGSDNLSGVRNLSGVAYKAMLLVVKLGEEQDSYLQSVRLLEALTFVTEFSKNMNMPIAINLSFGNNYGAHNGRSLLENYLDVIAQSPRCSVCIGTGNEGDKGIHFQGIVEENEEINAQFSIAPTQRNLNIQIWKNYFDEMDINMELPNGEVISLNNNGNFRFGNMEIIVFVNPPTPYNIMEEIYIEFIRDEGENFLEGGIYSINLLGRRILQGQVNMWMPSGNIVQSQTKFLNPTPDITLTIPSGAYRGISVGAYSSVNDTYADFSGRGFLTNGLIKPDICAPGVDIMAPLRGGGYSLWTGTSFATPIVTGTVALFLEWGIVLGNDTSLYGEKLKAYLIKGARQFDNEEIPSKKTGWGALCARDSFFD